MNRFGNREQLTFESGIKSNLETIFKNAWNIKATLKGLNHTILMILFDRIILSNFSKVWIPSH